ncbi:hypothetical protein SAMN05216593_10512 [Pseudomonas asturiensis]|uniref:Uncharacterized protein n=1 Tax=Pseudomonas asturiensis TaxID=1190415 RepID=A0A1M7MYZ6_9PSED|nr:hypothetical protein SAMN05216593_10512 [Pseudomonas asturiensis]
MSAKTLFLLGTHVVWLLSSQAIVEAIIQRLG